MGRNKLKKLSLDFENIYARVHRIRQLHGVEKHSKQSQVIINFAT